MIRNVWGGLRNFKRMTSVRGIEMDPSSTA